MYVCCGVCQYLDESRAQVMDQEPGDGSDGEQVDGCTVASQHMQVHRIK